MDGDRPPGAAAWEALNARQRATLAIVRELDHDAPARPGGPIVDFARDDRDAFGWTEMQRRLSRRGWDNQGNGSTVAALEDRGLLTRGSRATAFGRMRTVRLTAAGRAAAQAGASPAAGAQALSRRSWEVLALLHAAGRRGRALPWAGSTTIDRALIGRRDPPLAERVPGGYAITEAGTGFYLAHHAALAAAYPDVRARHPDEPPRTPRRDAAGEVLALHARRYRALLDQWEDATGARQAARGEAAAGPPAIPGCLPAPIAAQAAERHRVWAATARRRAGLAGAHARAAADAAARAALAYADAALAVWLAAAQGRDPPALAGPADNADAPAARALTPPARAGIDDVDGEAARLHAAAAAALACGPGGPGPPGAAVAALADFLRAQSLARLPRPSAGAPPGG